MRKQEPIQTRQEILALLRQYRAKEREREAKWYSKPTAGCYVAWEKCLARQDLLLRLINDIEGTVYHL